MKTALWSSAFKVAAATAVYAGMHSLLASRKVKTAADRIVGPRRRAAFYRPFYIAQSLVTFAGLYAYSRTLPDKTLYHVRGPAARLMNAGQLAALAYAIWAARQVGAADILGIREVRDFTHRKPHIHPEPEAQGPSPESANEMRITGPFRSSRHPLNFAPLPIFWLMPKMTVQLLAYNLVMTPYMILGSLHEEHRLQKAYGQKYERYQKSGVPFYLPRLWRSA
jgi:steroid 5-alpha reductase family enzyme